MQTAISTFNDRSTAEQAVDRLVAAGFPREDIHIESGEDADSSMTPRSTGTYEAQEDRGVLASIGHFFTSLFGMDTPDNEVHTYTEAVRRGHAVVVVDVDNEQDSERAVAIMNELGAVNMDERAQEWRAAGWTPGTQDEVRRELRSDEAIGEGTGRDQVLNVVQEELDVGKRQVDRGGVRVFQRVSEKPVRELVKLREERAIVERRDVDRPATQADLANFQEGAIEVRESTEEPVVAKSARVVEEVRVGKEVQERTETISDKVRRKDVDVERIEGQGTRRERAVASDESGVMRDATRTERDIDVDPTDRTDTPPRRER